MIKAAPRERDRDADRAASANERDRAGDGSMKTAPRERDRAASANARRTQVEHMKVVARMPTELSVEERNLGRWRMSAALAHSIWAVDVDTGA